MIITVTLNPAVDKTVKLKDFKVGDINRIETIRKDAGGKGINVSKVITELGGKTKALGFLAGNTGQFIANSLDELNINYSFTWTKGETRTNLKIIDTKNNHETEINEPGPQINKQYITSLENELMGIATTNDFVVLTGSLPPGLDQKIYAKLITDLKLKGVKVILDTSGQPLIEGLESKPYLIKPNLSELEELNGDKLTTTNQIVEMGKQLLKNGIKIIVISLGEVGSIVVSKEGCWKINPPNVEVASTIGAGDTLVAALAVKLQQGFILKEAIKYATAASAASVSRPGTQLCQEKEVEKLLSQVKINSIT